MNAELTAAERRELPDQIGVLSERAAAKAREIETAERQIEELSDDVTAGKAGAKALVLKLTAAVSESSIERNAILNTMAKLQARWDDDFPHRQREMGEVRRASARARAIAFMDASRELDSKVAETVQLVFKREELRNGFSEYHDIIDRNPQSAAEILVSVFANAGLDRVGQHFQRSAEPPHSFAEHDAESLRVVLPGDDVDVHRMTAFRAERDEEYRRRNDTSLHEWPEPSGPRRQWP